MAPNTDIMEPLAATADSELASVKKELHRLHSRWQCLTQEESAAIAASNWDLAIQHQTSKKRLQEETAGAKQHLQEVVERCGVDWAQLRSEFLPTVEELISMESRNRELLAAQLRQARARLRETNHSASNLQQLRHAYAHGANSVWQSYS